MPRVTSVHAFTELYIHLCTKLRASGSPLGIQLEILKNSSEGVFVRRDDGDASRAALNALDRIAFFGVVVRIWSTLTTEEQRVMLLKHTPAVSHMPGEGWKVEQFVIQREVRLSDLRHGDGLTAVGLLRDAAGELTGWVRAEETIARPWSDDEIAELLDITIPHVRRCVVRAGKKIRGHDLFPQLAEGL